jgi:hypothetical protein
VSLCSDSLLPNSMTGICLLPDRLLPGEGEGYPMNLTILSSSIETQGMEMYLCPESLQSSSMIGIVCSSDRLLPRGGEWTPKDIKHSRQLLNTGNKSVLVFRQPPIQFNERHLSVSQTVFCREGRRGGLPKISPTQCRQL